MVRTFWTLLLARHLLQGLDYIMIKLAEDTIDRLDVDHLIEWLKTFPKLTKGNLTLSFESAWANYIGTKHATFVNSGSSANLLMLYCLLESGRIKLNDKIVVPSVSWATDLSPVIQLGLIPIICDCNLDDFSVDIDHLKHIIINENPKALILVSVLGLIPSMEEIVNLCKDNDIILLEDCCESLGSTYGKQRLGSFGLMSSFSTYFGHHISTIEGGMVCTSDEEMNDLLKSLRNHGWDRDWNETKKSKMRQDWNIADFDALYTFYHPGFNMRSTDLQAFIGIKQLEKLPEYANVRNKNYLRYCENLNTDPQTTGYVSNFAFPIISRNRESLVKSLISKNIECRPLICGSMGTQPMYVKRYGRTLLKNAEYLKTNGMYVPNHQNMSQQDVDLVCSVIKETR